MLNVKFEAPTLQTFAYKRDDIVIDIETLGCGSDAVIVSIGALIFNRSDAPGKHKASFDVKVDFKNQKGRHIDADTMLWWMKDDMKAARDAALMGKNRVRLGLALKQLADFIALHKPDLVWACGPDFDINILQDAYRQHNVEFPVPFWNWACIRTIEKFFYGKNTRKPGGINNVGGLAHDALDDCIMEAMVVQNCYSCLQKVTKLHDVTQKVT